MQVDWVKITPCLVTMDHGRQGCVQCKTVLVGDGGALLFMWFVPDQRLERIVREAKGLGRQGADRCRRSSPQLRLIVVTPVWFSSYPNEVHGSASKGFD